jgi:hypothetical protein
MEIMERGGLLEAITLDYFYPSVQEGIDACLSEK